MADSLTWGGYSNGYIPESAMDGIGNFEPIYAGVTVGNNSDKLRADADRQLGLLQMAFQKEFDTPLNVSEAYRSHDRQVALRNDYLHNGGALAAEPGTSRHGWGLAVDFGSGVGSFGTKWKNWMDANAPKYVWVPAGNGFSSPEAWHFEFTGQPTITAGTGTTINLSKAPTPKEETMLTFVKLNADSSDPRFGKLTKGTQFVIDSQGKTMRKVVAVETTVWLAGDEARKLVGIAGNQAWELVTSGGLKRVGW